MRINYMNNLLNKNRRHEYFTDIMIFVIILLAARVMFECHGYVHINSIKLYERAALRNGSLFGYSIAYQPGIQRLVITAPQEDNIGQVYTTAINSSNVVKLPLRANLLPRKNVKHDFWFGATVKANSEFFITCAPRFAEKKNNKATRRKNYVRLLATLGICVANKYMNTDKYETIKLEGMNPYDRMNNAKEFEKQLDTFGWSIDITESDQILIGSPGMMTGRVQFYQNIHSKPLLLDKENKEKYRYNFGYSLTSRRFSDKHMVYIISSTFGNGKVIFFDSNKDIFKFIENQEVGSMFGAALCAARLGTSVLLIGAPTYSDNAYKHDMGAVYVYIDQTDEGFKNILFKRIIKGPSSGSYFGHAIENLGDIDGDEKDEVVIAAPFENGKGAVYIYSGASILDEKTPPIRIQPENFHSFGFSLAVLEDTDGNGSNELAIGSPLDNKVVVLKTFASIKIILSAELNPKDSDKDYVLKYCIETYLKRENITADLVIVIELRNAKFTKFPSKNRILENNLHLLYNQNKSCQELDLHVQTDESNTLANKLLMSYNITASLKEDPQKMTKFDPSMVLLSETQSVLNVQGQKWNPDNSKDEPKLSLNISSSMTQPYMIGSSYLESFTLSVVNAGGPAVKPCMEVSVEGARVVAYPRSCTHSADGLLCRHNQIIRTNSVWENVFKIDTNYLTSIHKSLVIRCDLYHQCGGGNKTTYEETIELKPYKNMVDIKGQSNPDRIVNMTMKDLQTGTSLEHVYTIYNYGLTNWVGVKSEMILESSSYIDYSKNPVKVYTYTSSTKCENVTSSKDDIIRVWCKIGNMNKQEKIIVVIAIAIVPEALEFESNDQNVSITTLLNLWLQEQDEVKYLSLSTTLTFATAEVPLWVILASSFVGIFLMIILSYVLYEYGFLRRKTKDKLIEKKQELHRRSMGPSTKCARTREDMNRQRNNRSEFQKQEDEDSV